MNAYGDIWEYHNFFQEDKFMSKQICTNCTLLEMVDDETNQSFFNSQKDENALNSSTMQWGGTEPSYKSGNIDSSIDGTRNNLKSGNKKMNGRVITSIALCVALLVIIIHVVSTSRLNDNNNEIVTSTEYESVSITDLSGTWNNREMDTVLHFKEGKVFMIVGNSPLPAQGTYTYEKASDTCYRITTSFYADGTYEDIIYNLRKINGTYYLALTYENVQFGDRSNWFVKVILT